MYENENYLQRLQELASRIASGDDAKNARGDPTNKMMVKTYTKSFGDPGAPCEFQLNAAPGYYNAIKPGMRHCFWFWLLRPDPESPMKKQNISKGAVYMGNGGAYVSPCTEKETAVFLIESGKLFEHFAESYFRYTIGRNRQYDELHYPELAKELYNWRIKRETFYGGKR